MQFDRAMGGAAPPAAPPSLRAKVRQWVISGLVALVLSLSAGLVVVGVLFTATSVAVAGTGAAYSGCQQTEADLASALGADAPTLRASDPVTVPTQIVERQVHGLLTAREAARANGWATTYADCRRVFDQAAE
ncbi:MAG: hypothetical protein AVDCRST_MAG18-5212 [uncultured Thermomicrobiales bacterium]|uniref:Uncharacterized protein n=1 Tax=uncultured Thermomicrobiales bacterium TaxID=1645740 RepID=A0A6J4VWU2_9BACT|nr:MAG: hypothetical protein AVDCRST_MAG18-5212 [uncultured Thermomicrobiales bacterium]